jgi:hypothetical protein
VSALHIKEPLVDSIKVLATAISAAMGRDITITPAHTPTTTATATMAIAATDAQLIPSPLYLLRVAS